MQRPSPFHRGRRQLELQMTPMIDVVFLLLVFFIWTSSFQIVENVLPSSMSATSGSTENPNDVPPPEADFDNVIVRMSSFNGTVHWTINDQDANNVGDVRQRLTAIAAINSDVPVILHPDPNVPLGSVIETYDVSRLAGFPKVHFAASEEI